MEPGVCAFAVRGPARYFGGETVVAAKVAAAVAGLGVDARAGIADGLFAALLAAGSGQIVPAGGTTEFLARQPVSVLDDADLSELLHRLGIRTLGDLAALPVRDVVSRFGAAGERAHRQASGWDARPLAGAPPPDDLSVAQEFDPPEANAEPLVFTAKALAEQMHATLRAKGLTCVRVQVQVKWEDGRENSRLWRHDGFLSAVQVADRVRWQLDGWRTKEPEEEREAGGITLLRLTPDQVVRATGQQLALWGEAVITDRVARAAMRVQALLGHQAVLRPLLEGGRNVDEQVTHRPFGENEEPSRAKDQPWPGRIPGAAPAAVFPEPRDAAVTDRGGRPVTVSGRCEVSAPPQTLAVDGGPPREITGWAGPWPLAERWWDPDSASRRARFQLVTEDGRAWLAAVRGGRWRIEAGYW
ncbi:MAG: DNA polymerase Y family protein [Streptosporangiaceae bacterium]|nr:DNA polymerase Y family protein [Streptosporangiaceae bacterium]